MTRTAALPAQSSTHSLFVFWPACVCVSTQARGYGIPYGMWLTGDTSKMHDLSPHLCRFEPLLGCLLVGRV